ncbi:efflux RND transporter periplasmic adaptor subunit [Caulobacter mirabilis]|uniref:Efflux transporter periplasmic adaptor subunit n=1 Tax=Caulobacter mirabilis TaxID=69666 RepID=A0A2D2AXK5_9CAUL|nr:efflux RND transporter periplasmic adaptor subunit [Caulobacter mirabilis]ATQ42711.1 efflux transporter periplasmic adaptor subunit [Caulobacter mirabilis]
MSLNSSKPPRRNRLPRPVVYGLTALVVLAAAFAGWQLLKPKAPKDPYRTEAVQQGDITKSVSASGSLQALVTVDVGSQISGQIDQVFVDFNDQVKAGQLLATLDPQTYVSRQRQGQAQVAQAQAGVAQAQAQAAEAQAAYNRTKALFDKGIVAPAALETAEAAWKTARAGIQSAQASVAQNRASLAATEVDLGRTKIVSPINGVVVNRAIEPGNTVAASLQAPVLFQIAQDLSKLEVKITVDEADIGQVVEGQTVRFTVDAFPDDTYTGVVTQVRKQAETDQNVVAYVVIAQADNPGGKLLPGMTANADIVLQNLRGVMKVPAAALRWTPADQASSSQQRGPGGPPGVGGPPPGGGQRQGSGQGGQRQGMMGGRMLEQLDLDAGQKAKAEAIFAEARTKAQAAASDDPQARRQAMRKAMEEALTKLEPILKPAQKEKLIALRARMAQMGGGRGRGGMTAGVVYVLRDKKPAAVPVRVGATDGSFTQIVGDLKPGDQVIIGGGPKAKVQARGGPMGGGQVRVRM